MDWARARFAQKMASTARGLPAQESVDSALERITASAIELGEGPCPDAGRTREGERVFRIPGLTWEEPGAFTEAGELADWLLAWRAGGRVTPRRLPRHAV